MSSIDKTALSQQTAICQDPVRMKESVNAMARCLSKIMVLRDPELAPRVAWNDPRAVLGMQVNKGRLSRLRQEYWRRWEASMAHSKPFGRLQFEEFEVKTTPQQEELISKLYIMDDFAKKTIEFCEGMIDESDEAYEGDFHYCEPDPDDDEEWKQKINSDEFKNNIDLWYYAHSVAKSPYFFKCNYTRPNKSLVIPIGGMVGTIYQEFERLALEWLHSCDKIFCQVHNIHYAEHETLSTYIANVASAVARRHSLLSHPTDASKPEYSKTVDSVLNPLALNLQAVEYYWENNAQAFHDRNSDVDALKSLLVIAKQGGRTHEAQSIILKKTTSIQRVIEEPPQELGLHIEKRVKKFNFSALRKILNFGIENPFLCRCECAQTWYENHGEWAAVELQIALDWINRDDVRAGTHYLELVGTERQKGSVELPHNPCAYEELNWFTQLPHYTKRSTLSSIGIRFVCLTTFLRKRVESGTIKYGTSNKQIVHNVATDHLHKASYARAMLESDRLQCNQGVGLLLFERDLCDLSSDVSNELDLPFCELSRFSFAELDLVFSNRVYFNLVRHRLSSETRKLVSNTVVPEAYTRFTDDTLSMLLDVIKARRVNHGLNVVMHLDPLTEMLRCTPKVRDWIHSARSPGTSTRPSAVTLCLKDFKTAHPQMRSLLEERARETKRTCNPLVWQSGNSKHHEQTLFLVDGDELEKLLSVPPASHQERKPTADTIDNEEMSTC